MKRKHMPIVRYGWKDALKAVTDGCSLFEYEDGHAEILNNGKGPYGDRGAIGFLTKRSVELLHQYQFDMCAAFSAATDRIFKATAKAKVAYLALPGDPPSLVRWEPKNR